MESPERAAVRNALASLRPYLEAYVASIVGEAEAQVAKRGPPRASAVVDIPELVGQITRRWKDVFARHLPRETKSYLHELRDIRNRWAHEEEFSQEEVGDLELIVQEYAAAERRGEVERKQNASGLTSEGYARALYADAIKKGWLGVER